MLPGDWTSKSHKFRCSSVVWDAKKKDFQKIFKETPRRRFLDEYEQVKAKLQNDSLQFVNCVLSHLVAADMEDTIMPLNFDKWSRWYALIDTQAEHTTNNH